MKPPSSARTVSDAPLMYDTALGGHSINKVFHMMHIFVHITYYDRVIYW